MRRNSAIRALQRGHVAALDHFRHVAIDLQPHRCRIEGRRHQRPHRPEYKEGRGHAGNQPLAPAEDAPVLEKIETGVDRGLAGSARIGAQGTVGIARVAGTALARGTKLRAVAPVSPDCLSRLSFILSLQADWCRLVG